MFTGAGCGSPSRDASYQHFRSRPDLTPPVITVTRPARGTAPGYIFIAPKHDVAQAGPMILDDTGQLIWFKPLDTHGVTDFRVQTYHGRPVLTWWRGHAVKGIGDGYDVIVDSSYREVARVRAGNGLAADVHEFLLTPRGTALITVYRRMPFDLSAVGGPRQGKLFDGLVQELDVATGRVLFEWHSIEHVPVEESYSKPPPARRGAAAAPYDYFHINSIEPDTDGNLLISARNTHAIYEIDGSSGDVIWRLGGKKSDFAMGPGTHFAWQHDARRQPDGTITLFDNDADPPLAKESRGLVLRVDTARRRAELVHAYASPDALLSSSQGNLQLLPDGHAFIGWGANPYFTEFDGNGHVVFDGHFKAGADSYRAYRLPWKGRPQDPPALALTTDRRGRVTAYVSWNGATDVTRWQVVAGPDPRHLDTVAVAAKTGFETAIPLDVLTDRYVTVRARGASGELIGSSAARKRP